MLLVLKRWLLVGLGIIFGAAHPYMPYTATIPVALLFGVWIGVGKWWKES